MKFEQFLIMLRIFVKDLLPYLVDTTYLLFHRTPV